jgi:hypothetical protein
VLKLQLVPLVRRAGGGRTRALAGVGSGTYKKLFRGGRKGGLLGRGLHVLRHVDEVGLAGFLVELGLKGGQKRIARHWSAAGAVTVLAGGRGEGG